MADSAVPSRPVRVVIVDDTRTIRGMIRVHLSRSPAIEVVGEASDPYEARDLIRRLNPDVITLDVVMPRMDGLSFLERLMRLRPMPVVMVSARTTENSREAITALTLGAVDCVDLALLNSGTSKVDLAEMVLMAAGCNVGGFAATRDRTTPADAQPLDWNGKSVLIGSSTGGVDALLTVLSGFPQDCPPTIIAQHMPESFLQSFARRLDRSCAARVALARDREKIGRGHVYLGPGGDCHVALAPRDRSRLRLVPDGGSEPYVPSVNLLFASGVPHAAHIVGVMLTGMGRDGAEALLALRQAGAHTIVQDAATSVIDGMPRSAREMGAAVEVAALADIAGRIIHAVSGFRQGQVRGQGA